MQSVVTLLKTIIITERGDYASNYDRNNNKNIKKQKNYQGLYCKEVMNSPKFIQIIIIATVKYNNNKKTRIKNDMM